MNVLAPIPITASMILAGTTIAEPAAGETAWVANSAYALGDLRIRSTTHRVYKCALAHTGSAALPENDPTRWKDFGPTLRYAPFDWYVSTAATATTTLTYVLQPGFFNAISMYGLVGTTITVSVKDAPGGTEIYRYTGLLSEPPLGWYEYLFAPLRPITKIVLTEIPIRPAAELTITLPSAAGAAVGVGMINIGDFRPLMGNGEWGGTEYGASAEPVSYSWVKTYEDGTIEIKKRGKGTGLTASVVMPQESTDYALACIQEVLDIPVSFIASLAPGYGGLNAFGLGSGKATYESVGYSRVSITVKASI